LLERGRSATVGAVLFSVRLALIVIIFQRRPARPGARQTGGQFRPGGAGRAGCGAARERGARRRAPFRRGPAREPHRSRGTFHRECGDGGPETARAVPGGKSGCCPERSTWCRRWRSWLSSS
jgi:hypothetical protein